jgi:predicted metal-dependent phosphoesterase TrpH
LVYHWHGKEVRYKKPFTTESAETAEMKIDLQVHTKTGSDGNLPVEDVLKEAKRRSIELLSITDHDSVVAQAKAIELARRHGIPYITGIELNVTFEYPSGEGKSTKSHSLDFLGYQYDIENQELKNKLQLMRQLREARARKILENLNAEFDKEGIERFTEKDLENIQATVDGAFGRPHIANYLVKKGIVKDKQEAFDKYLVKCDVPKYPLSLAEASRLIRNAGGVLVFAHPNEPNGTSLVTITRELIKQTKIIEEYMLEHLDGIECWHTNHNNKTTAHYIEFCKSHNLIMTGGSDCHQNPIIMGTLDIPAWVAEQFKSHTTDKVNKSKGVL